MRNSKKFSQYAEFLTGIVEKKSVKDDFEVVQVVSDSGKVLPGALFCAVKGVKNDGNLFIPAAVERGATGVIGRDAAQCGKNFIQVSEDRLAYSEAVRYFYDEPDKDLKLFGVTGTNGKTTSVYLFFHLLKLLGHNPALFSTVENFDGLDFKKSSCTMPDAGELFAFCRRSFDNGADYMLCECSSHALAQKRVGRAEFQAAIFTNLTGDHLDYHNTMEDYFTAKKVLFTENLASDGIAVVNIDDVYGAELAGELAAAGKNVVTFGFSPDAAMRMEEDEKGFIFAGRRIESSLTGRHNFYNISGVLSVLCSSGFALAECVSLLKKNPLNVPGRLEKIDLHSHGTAFVDYAHTDDALKNVLQILRRETAALNGRLICVFGCGGNRDRSKRPRMGRVVSEFADEFIVTSDNPRDEEPEDIINEILVGCIRKPYCISVEREEAIKSAVALARANDIVLVAGKGHEKEQIIKGGKIYFDDCEILRKYCDI